MAQQSTYHPTTDGGSSPGSNGLPLFRWTQCYICYRQHIQFSNLLLILCRYIWTAFNIDNWNGNRELKRQMHVRYRYWITNPFAEYDKMMIQFINITLLGVESWHNVMDKYRKFSDPYNLYAISSKSFFMKTRYKFGYDSFIYTVRPKNHAHGLSFLWFSTYRV